MPPHVDRGLSDPELLRQVNALRRIDNFTNWLYLAREYLYLAAVIGLTIAFYYLLLAAGVSLLWAIPVTLVAILCVGAGQHRLGALTHESAHYLLFRNRVLNELVSEWFCMLPMLGTTHRYRVQHMGHHQYPNDPERDPDWAQLRLSGHRFRFPMARAAFLWHGVVKQLLLPHLLVGYALARARFVVDQGEGTPYRMKRHHAVVLKLLGVGYHVALLAILAMAVWSDNAALLASVPMLLAAGLAVYALAPERWVAEYAIRPDISVRWTSCMRLAFNTLAWSALAGLTIVTGMPWWLFYAVLWVVPLGTSFAFFMILRQLVQHGNADRERFTNTRVFLVNPLISFAVFPLGQDYHLPHHLFPLVPHFNLRKLHELLSQLESYRDQVIVVKGYFRSPPGLPRHPTVLDLVSQDNGSDIDHFAAELQVASVPDRK
jgi:fatty acid desaturase